MDDEHAIRDDATGLLGEFTGLAAPVQAEGVVGRRAFYFRSRYQGWTFAIALTPDVDPADIDFPDQGFLREGAYGALRYDASYMPLDEALKIIVRCAAEFAQEHPA